MRKYQQNADKRTSPFLYFAAENYEETERKHADGDQQKFGRSQVWLQIKKLMCFEMCS